MPRYPLEVADIFRQYGPSYRHRWGTSLSLAHHRTMRDIEVCRTAVLGGHIDQCDKCGQQRNSYNSCRNRHCPKCQNLTRARWLKDRQAELLPVDYFHVVFTLPECIAEMALQNKKVVYDILFQATAEALQRIATDPDHLGAGIGFIAILHTWGQNLMHHPHIHCVVPGGGLSPNRDRWISSRKDFFLPVRVLSRLFRRLFLEHLSQSFEKKHLRFHGSLEHLNEDNAFYHLLKTSRTQEWVVYAKPPFGGPEHVLEYLGRYTHRVAISNNRLQNLEDGLVTFTWKDYRSGNHRAVMTLDAHEFIRRFLLHVLPTGFVRIRHYGFLANRHRAARLAQCMQALNVDETSLQEKPSHSLDWKAQYEALTGKSLTLCPSCQRGHLLCIEVIQPLRYQMHTELVGVDSS